MSENFSFSRLKSMSELNVSKLSGFKSVFTIFVSKIFKYVSLLTFWNEILSELSIKSLKPKSNLYLENKCVRVLRSFDFFDL